MRSREGAEASRAPPARGGPGQIAVVAGCGCLDRHGARQTGEAVLVGQGEERGGDPYPGGLVGFRARDLSPQRFPHLAAQPGLARTQQGGDAVRDELVDGEYSFGGFRPAFLFGRDPGVLHQQGVGAGGEQVGQGGEIVLGELVEEEAEGLFLLPGEELLEEAGLLLLGQGEEGIGEAVHQLLEALEIARLKPLVEEAVLVEVEPGRISRAGPGAFGPVGGDQRLRLLEALGDVGQAPVFDDDEVGSPRRLQRRRRGLRFGPRGLLEGQCLEQPEQVFGGGGGGEAQGGDAPSENGAGQGRSRLAPGGHGAAGVPKAPAVHFHRPGERRRRAQGGHGAAEGVLLAGVVVDAKHGPGHHEGVDQGGTAAVGGVERRGLGAAVPTRVGRLEDR